MTKTDEATLEDQELDPSLLADLDELEQMRRGVVRSQLICLAIAVGAALLFVGSLGVGIEGGPIVTGIAGALVTIGGLIWASTRFNRYRSTFKSQVIAKLIVQFDPGLRYEPEGFVSESQFRASRIFTTSPDRYNGEDRVVGRVGETDLEFSEVHAEYESRTTDSKGRTQTHWVTIFRGVLFVADFHKHFQGTTVVLPDSLEKSFGFLGKTLQSWNAFRGGSLVSLEDPEFEKTFVVYGTDQVEARYILSPSLMQRLVALREKFDAWMALSFVDSRMVLAIRPKRDLFEPTVYTSLRNTEQLTSYREDLRRILGIVEDLNLNTRIWSKA